MLTIFFKFFHIFPWRKNMLTINIFKRTEHFSLIYIPYKSILQNFWISFLFDFVRLKFTLNMPNYVQIRHYAKLESITFPVNTIFIHFMFLKNFKKRKCFPYSYQNRGKKQIFCLNFLWNNYFKLYWIRFYIRCIDYNTCIKTSTNKLSWDEILVEKREKWEIFSFADFHLKTHKSPFF